MSNTLSKPRRRSAAAILPVTEVPIGIPNSSPSAARTAGAGCTTTNFVGSLHGVPYLGGIVFFGQRAGGAGTFMHWPQLMHREERQQAGSNAGRYDAVEAAVRHADDADVLHLVAHGDAAAAQYALGQWSRMREGEESSTL